MRNQCHPPAVLPRLLRAMRVMHVVRGWDRLVDAVVPPGAAVGEFVIRNRGTWFAGDLASFVDRRVYLFGGYEVELIREFEARVPRARRGVILDIGANAGTHSLAFARSFKTVHSFEPNSRLWANFEHNLRLNGFGNVSLHRVGLAEHDSKAAFYSISENQHPLLGTFSEVEQYDKPLVNIGTADLINGDQYLDSIGVSHVDAIKVDVQGFEPNVLRGLKKTISRDRPYVWLETGFGASGAEWTTDFCRSFFPYPCSILRFQSTKGKVTNHTRLVPTSGAVLENGDYLILPKGE